MPQYDVYMSVTLEESVCVDAESEEEAHRLAEEQVRDMIGLHDADVTVIWTHKYDYEV